MFTHFFGELALYLVVKVLIALFWGIAGRDTKNFGNSLPEFKLNT